MQLFWLIGERLINELVVLVSQASLVAAVAHKEAYAQSYSAPEDNGDATLKAQDSASKNADQNYADDGISSILFGQAWTFSAKPVAQSKC